MNVGRRPTRPIVALLVVAAIAAIAVVGVLRFGPGGTPDIGKGKAAPGITGTTLDGTAFDLASLRGKPVIINFWASWCGPCQEEMPLLAQKAAAHAASGLAIIGVLSDDSADNGRTFESRYGATWPTVYDANGAIKAVYRVIGRPQSYFVDRNGVLQSIQVGYLTDADFERQLALIAGGG